MKTTIFTKSILNLFQGTMLLGAAVCLNANVMFAQSGLWQANGGSIVFTNRNVGIGTSAPTDKLQVAGRVNAIHFKADSLMQALEIKAQSAEFTTALVTGFLDVNGQITAGSLVVSGNTQLADVSAGNATINGQLTTDNITSSSGSIDFGNNNLGTTGNVNSANISALQLSDSVQHSQISNLTSQISSIQSSQWTTLDTSSISYSGDVFVNSLNAQNFISIGAFRFSNGATPAPIRRDSIYAPNKLVIGSQEKTIELSADTVTMKELVGIGKRPSVALDVAGDIAASGNLQLAGLAGTGNRILMVDSNGVLKPDPTACVGLDNYWRTDGNVVPPNCNPFIGTTTAKPFNIRTSNFPRMTIEAGGNVGIGTTTTLSPNIKLEVNGSISILGENGNRSLFFGREQTTLQSPADQFGEWGIQYLSGGPNGTGTGVGGLNFWKPSGSDGNFGNYFLFLSDNGNAGIGNNNPQATLDVTGTIKSSSLAGTGTNMIIADASGLLSTQAIPAAQTLSISQNQLTISGGNTVILPDNDNQTLSVSLNTLSISGGNSVTLPSGADNLGNHSATQDIKLNGHRITNSSSSSLGFTIQNNSGDGRFDNNLFVNGDLTVNQNTQMNGTLTVNGFCYNSTGTWIISDTRYKKNIEELESPLKKVLKIRGVRYEYNMEGFPKLNFKEGKTIGFIAQELKEVFPEAVMLKEDGYYAVNYDEIVPVLVEAIKEQQKMIEAKDTENNSIKDELTSIKNQLAEFTASLQECCKNQQNTTGSIQNNIPNGAMAYLEQNIPNPFTQNTVINYYLPVQTSSASIIIFDLQGNQLKKVESLSKGKGSVTIKGGELYAGMFIYVLIADGKEMDYKRMILTK